MLAPVFIAMTDGIANKKSGNRGGSEWRWRWRFSASWIT
jgi:hypothetical protein